MAGIRWLKAGVISCLVAGRSAAGAQRTYVKLSHLSDRELAEVGLTRDNIAAVALRDLPSAVADTTHSEVGPGKFVGQEPRKAA